MGYGVCGRSAVFCMAVVMMRWLALILLLLPGIAHAASTINPALPQQGLAFQSSPIRNNFQAAANDIGALQTCNLGVTAPSVPSSGYCWWNTSANPSWTYNFYDEVTQTWIPTGTLNSTTGVWSPAISWARVISPTTVAPATNLGTTPITASGSELLATTDQGIPVVNLIGTNVNYDTFSAVAHETSGSALTNINAVAGYCLNDNARGGVPANSCVAGYFWAQDRGVNSQSWGVNGIANTTPGVAGQVLFGAEFDTNFSNTTDIGNGIWVAGASSAQPASASAIAVALLDYGKPTGTALWSDGLITVSGCCTIGAQFGALAPSGASVSGQPVFFDFTDSSAAVQSYTLQASPTSFNFGGSQTSPSFQFGGSVVLASGSGHSLILGPAVTSGANVSSQMEIFDYVGSSVPQTYNMQATPTSLNFAGTQTTPVFQFGGNVVVATGFSLQAGPDTVLTNTSHAIGFANGASITSVTIGNSTATLSLGIANGGAATKYVCVDSANNIVLQTGAC